MKRNYFLMLIIFFAYCLNAQTVVWSTDFEDLTGFITFDNDGDGVNWTSTITDAQVLGFSLGRVVHSSSWPYNDIDNLLFTPYDAISIPNDVASINFKLKVGGFNYFDSGNYEEHFQVFVSEDPIGNDVLTIETLIHDQIIVDGGMGNAQDISIDIPLSYAGKDIMLIIRHFDSNNGYSFILDDFEVSYTETLSIDDSNLTQINIYPNPVKDILKIDYKVPIETITINNQIGQEVMRINKSNLINSEIDLSSLNIGIYILRLETESGVVSKKIIKK